jgi:hypothetical protein
MVEVFFSLATASTVVEKAIINTSIVVHNGINNIVSKSKFSTSNSDSFLENLPPSDAVNNIIPLAPRPAKH